MSTLFLGQAKDALRAASHGINLAHGALDRLIQAGGLDSLEMENAALRSTAKATQDENDRLNAEMTKLRTQNGQLWQKLNRKRRK